MAFPYREVFQLVEESLIRYGSRRKAPEQIRKSLDSYKLLAGRNITDDQYFATLLYVVFYSGFRAETVTARKDVINRWFPDWQTVSRYGESEIAAIMADRGMIRNRRKVAACVQNAKVMRQLIEEFGSFDAYIASFGPLASLENLLLLKEELEYTFGYLGGITVYHFLTDIGMPVLKPDRVICRIFKRLGLIEADKQLLKTVLQGRKFADATGLPIRYVDIVFVSYGQVQSEDIGIDRGICLKDPRCGFCGVQDFCSQRRTQRSKTAPVP
jgi:DNA-3-methyladenine glycosylase I